MNSHMCPICGTHSLELTEKNKNIKYPYAGEAKIKIKEYYCPNCDIAGDFFYENDDKINNAINTLKSKSVNNIIAYFNENKVSMTAIERILSIPFRTLSRWKNNTSKPSAAAIALFKYLRTFPWLLDVADHDFDDIFSKNMHLFSAMQMCSETGTNSSADIYSDSNTLYIQMQFKKSTEQISSDMHDYEPSISEEINQLLVATSCNGEI